MKANFKIISTILIILLASLLITIMISYYSEPIEINNEYINEFASTNQEISKVISENISGENVITDVNVFTEQSGEILIDFSGEKSGEGLSTIKVEKENTDKKESQKDNNVDKTSTSVIITSEDAMTNKEKREILTELDTTLMDLLDVIDKVQTIDETRLIIDESGVQE